MHQTSDRQQETDVDEHDDTGLADYIPLAILAYCLIGLVVATTRLDSSELFGPAHLLGFIGDIVGWPLALIGVV